MDLASLPLAAGLGNTTTYLAVAACVLALMGSIFCIFLSRRVDKLSLGKNGSLEDALQVLTAHMHDMQSFRSELEVYLKHAETRIRSSVRGVGIVRYNPFANDGSSGGNQSFAIAFLDETHSGVVLSALYARAHVGVYAKPLIAGTSTFTLSDEEQEAIEKARQSLAEKKRGEQK